MTVQSLLYDYIMANSDWVRDVQPDEPNPRIIDDEPWYRELCQEGPEIRREWNDFVDRGGRVPIIDDLLGGPQGNESGIWRMAVLIRHAKPAQPFADEFPTLTPALLKIPNLRHAMLSIMEPGTAHPMHWGCNAGTLRFLYGIDCPEGSGFRIEGHDHPLRDNVGVLFDDTWAHESWNDGDRPRVIILCDLVKPLRGWAGIRNRFVQQAYSRLAIEYRRSIPRGVEWHNAYQAVSQREQQHAPGS